MLELQAQISATKLERLVGRQLRVLVDEVDEEEGITVARSFRDAPDVDGIVTIEGTEGLSAGDFVWVEVEAATEHDLFSRQVGRPLNFN